MRAAPGRRSVQRPEGGACRPLSGPHNSKLINRMAGRWTVQRVRIAEGGACNRGDLDAGGDRCCRRWSAQHVARWKAERAGRGRQTHAGQGATRQTERRILSLFLSLLFPKASDEGLADARLKWTGPQRRSRRVDPLTLRALKRAAPHLRMASAGRPISYGLQSQTARSPSQGSKFRARVFDRGICSARRASGLLEAKRAT